MDKDSKDAVYDGGSGMFSLLPSPWDAWQTIPGGRDGGRGANLVFADGHAEGHKWRCWPKHRADCANADDLEDLRWLQKRLIELE